MGTSSRDDVTHCFKRGAEVEISCKDEGLQGSWYTGTIIVPPANSKRSSTVLVEYKTLIENEKTMKPLREEVEMLQIRPSPPPENRSTFKIADDVDAYYRDGWWEGVVSGVLKDNKYLVFFRGSREQIAFEGSKLRRHHEWVYGKWLPSFDEPLAPEPMPDSTCSHEERVPSLSGSKRSKTEVPSKYDSETQAQTISPDRSPSPIRRGPKIKKVEVPSTYNLETEAHTSLDRSPSPIRREPKRTKVEHDFAERDRVEVQIEDEGFEGSWYAAKIVKKVKTDRYLVKYRTLRNEDDTGRLKEEVDCDHIRPSPPPLETLDGFEVRDQVDALYHDGWWTGVVQRVLINGRYLVYFSNSEEELKFAHADLRIHQEWKHGKWIVSSKVAKL